MVLLKNTDLDAKGRKESELISTFRADCVFSDHEAVCNWGLWLLSFVIIIVIFLQLATEQMFNKIETTIDEQ